MSTVEKIIEGQLVEWDNKTLIIRRVIHKGQKPTPEQIEEIRALKDRPIVFDEDCPELTDEQLKQFKRVNPRREEKAVS